MALNRWTGKKKRKVFREYVNPYESITKPINAVFPLKLHELLQQHAKRLGLPMARLVAIAVDNELNSPEPFDFPCDPPETKYVEYAYMEEAVKVYAYIKQFGERGIGIEFLTLARRDMGIPNKLDMFGAIRELFMTDMIEWCDAPGNKYFQYGEDIRFVRCKNLTKEKVEDESGRTEELLESSSDDE